MKGVDFELEKEKLATQLELTPDPPQGEIDEKGVSQRVRHFLLDERLIPLIKKRLRDK